MSKDEAEPRARGSASVRLLPAAVFALLCVGLSWVYWTQAWPPSTRAPHSVLHASPVAHFDGVYYYAFLRSLSFDGDLDFENDYALLVEPFRSQRHESTGRLGNLFSIGPALLWAPFMLVARGLGAISDGWGPPDGSGERFQRFVFFASCLYGWAAIVLSYLAARKAYRAPDALIAALAVLFGTPLYWYMMRQASYSHACSAFVSALLVLLWLRGHGSLRPLRWLVLGLVCGLGMSVRPAFATHALVPAAELVPSLVTSLRTRDMLALRQQSLTALAFVIGVLLGFMPQMLAWKALYGAYLVVPQGDDFMLWSASRYLAVLFSAWNGWVAQHPLVLLGLLGLTVTAFRAPARSAFRALARAALLVIAAQAFVNGATADWYGGWAFGGRRFTDATVYIVLGVTQLFALLGDRTLHEALARLFRYAIPATCAVCFAYFSLFLGQQRLHARTPLHGPLDLVSSWKDAMTTAVDEVYAVTGNLGSMPMSWWYAVSGKVSPARFDRADTDDRAELGESVWSFEDLHVALGGFGATRSVRGRTYRWLAASEARFAFLVRQRVPLRARLELTATVPGMRISLRLGGETLLDSEVATTLQPLTFTIPAHLLRTGSNFVHVAQTKSSRAAGTLWHRLTLTPVE